MINIELEYTENTVKAHVSDSESNRTTTVGGNNAPQAIQSALTWASLNVKIREVATSDKVSVSKDVVAELEADSLLLQKLYSAGVDNWEGFDEAQNM